MNFVKSFQVFPSSVDPDPYLERGSGSTKLMNTDPILIRFRIHNTALQQLKCRKDDLGIRLSNMTFSDFK